MSMRNTIADIKHARKQMINISETNLTIALGCVQKLHSDYTIETLEKAIKNLHFALDGLSQSRAYANIQYTEERDPEGNNENYRYD